MTEWLILQTTALIVGFIIDCFVGDPYCIPHPVIGIGKWISLLDKKLRRGNSNPNDIPNEEKHSEYYEFGLTIYDSAWEEEPTSDFKIVFLPIEKIELVSKTYNEQDLLILTVENGYINITKNS